jgi:hypothetical protein
MQKHIVYSLFACLVFVQFVVPVASAQSGEGRTTNDGLAGERILAGRNLYVEHGSLEHDGVGHRQHNDLPGGAGGAGTLSELAQNKPATAVPRQVWYPRGRSHGGSWGARRGNGRHVLIGALIGFGIGAAIGAQGNRDPSTRGRITAPVLFGSAGALIGAAVGASHP